MLWLGSFSYLNFEKATLKAYSVLDSMFTSYEREIEIIDYKKFLLKKDENTSGFLDFKEYLPFNHQMIVYEFKTNFMFNFEIGIFLLLSIMVFHIFIIIFYFIVKKKYFKKIDLLNNLKLIRKQLEFKVYIAYVLKLSFIIILNFLL